VIFLEEAKNDVKRETEISELNREYESFKRFWWMTYISVPIIYLILSLIF
jgi:hypothetical protein